MISRTLAPMLLLLAIAAAPRARADALPQPAPAAATQAEAAPAAATQAQPAHAPTKWSDLTPEQQAKIKAVLQGSGWSVGAGVTEADPGYVGFSRQATFVPQFFYHYGRFFVSGLDVGYLFGFSRHYRFSVGVSPDFRRVQADDSPQLAGLQTRERSVDANANLTLLGDWGSWNLSVSHDILHRSNGTDLDTGYSHGFKLGGWNITPGIGVEWQDADEVDYYYGVTPAEAIPGRPVYTPGSSLNPHVGLGFSTDLGAHWSFNANLGYTRFGSAIHDSPLIDRSGSPSIYIGFTYSENTLRGLFRRRGR